MGKPVQGHAWTSPAEYIGGGRQTRGTDTSQYPEEEKSTEIPLVAASERGLAQTEKKQFFLGLWDLAMRPGGVAERPGKVGQRG